LVKNEIKKTRPEPLSLSHPSTNCACHEACHSCKKNQAQKALHFARPLARPLHTMRLKRRVQPANPVPTIGEAALSISRLCKHIVLIKSKRRAARPVHEPASTEERQATAAAPSITLDSLHWQQAATTLLSENAHLRESLKEKEKHSSDVSSRLFQLSQSHANLEKQLAASTRELLVMSADSLTPPPMMLRAMPNIPVSTQGKDAMYWHQACRTLQMQYLELKGELENKTDQFLRLTASYRALLKRQEDECPRSRETPPPRGRPPFSTGCATGAP
jgi:hypothetical protein